jgi:16S rRNA (cytosine967-C5)-methyltransferase
MIETKLLNPRRELESLSDIENSCDIVLVDAPCSGSGTWRRNPETRWRLTPPRLEQLVEEQARLLDIASGLVRQGGCLVYAVCSLIDREGQQQIAKFLSRHSGWKLSAIANSAGRALDGGIMLTPAHDGTDGFFFARLEKL